MKFRKIVNSFLGGQISPTAAGRTDIPTYPHSCDLLQNMIPLLSGGAYRRPGTLFRATYPISTDYAPSLIEFVRSNTEAYALLFGQTIGSASYVKFFNANSSTSGTVTGTHPYLVGTGNNQSNVDEFQEIQTAQSVDKLWIVHPKHIPYIVSRTAANTLTIKDYETDLGLSEQTLANGRPYLNMNTNTVNKLELESTTGNGKWLRAHGLGHTPFDNKLNRDGTSAWIGSIFRIDDGVNVSAIKITAYTSTTELIGDIILAANGTNGGTGYSTWWESAWSDYRGWPRTVGIFQQRMVMGGTEHQPDTVWFSQTGNLSKWSTLQEIAPAITQLPPGVYSGVLTGGYIHYPVDDSEGDGVTTGPTGIQPFRITLTQNSLDQLQWLSPEKELLIGTLAKEWVIATQNGRFDIANSPTGQQSSYGSNYVPAKRIGYELLFSLASKKEVRAYQYNFVDSSFFAEPVQLYFDDYPKPDYNGYPIVRKIAWDGDRSTLWCMDTAGNFYGMTRDRKVQTTMWHTHKFGGYDTSKGAALVGSGDDTTLDMAYRSCDGSVVSFCVVPSSTGLSKIFFVIKRTIDGVVNWQVESLQGGITSDPSAYGIGFGTTISFVDSAVLDTVIDPTDPGEKTKSGLGHLNGYTSLTANYRSATYGLFKLLFGAVSGGSATTTGSFPPEAGVVTIGLPFTSIIQPCRPDAGSQIGSAQGALKRINRVFVRFYKTMAAKVGAVPGSETVSGLEVIPFSPSPATSMSKSPELFTGDKRVDIPNTYERDGGLYLVQDEPFPFTVVSITMEGTEYD